MEMIRMSVRALVEFTLHGTDIGPVGSRKDMQDGMLGHKARQGLLCATIVTLGNCCVGSELQCATAHFTFKNHGVFLSWSLYIGARDALPRRGRRRAARPKGGRAFAAEVARGAFYSGSFGNSLAKLTFL